jgi:hypothetical protein
MDTVIAVWEWVYDTLHAYRWWIAAGYVVFIGYLLFKLQRSEEHHSTHS